MHPEAFIRKSPRQRRQRVGIQNRSHRQLVKNGIAGRFLNSSIGHVAIPVNDKRDLAQGVRLIILRRMPLVIQPVRDRFQIPWIRKGRSRIGHDSGTPGARDADAMRIVPGGCALPQSRQSRFEIQSMLLFSNLGRCGGGF